VTGPQHALLRGLRNPASETELTRALASVFAVEPTMASEFVELVCTRAPHAARVNLDGLPSYLECLSEQSLAEGRADLSFVNADRSWHVIVELKIHAGYGHDQLKRYLNSFHVGASRTVLVAVTRDVPTYGDLGLADARWAGSVQWVRLLPHMRALKPSNADLAEQWPLFLDVLEEEGSMGFTQADPGLFKTWAGYYDARKHMVDFMNHMREPLLEALRESLGPGLSSDERHHLAAYRRPGKARIVVVKPRLGKVPVRFRVPADGPERISTGLWGWGEPRFVVEVPYPNVGTSGADAAISKLLGRGFENWRDRNQVLWRYLPLDDTLIQSAGLENRVLEFAHKSFKMLVASGFLDLPPADANVLPEALPEVEE
jgi:hypothetical protein